MASRFNKGVKMINNSNQQEELNRKEKRLERFKGKKGDLNRKSTHDDKTKHGMLSSKIPTKVVYSKMLNGK
jgi:hypothetical protein